jgi:hypothetical protein
MLLFGVMLAAAVYMRKMIRHASKMIWGLPDKASKNNDAMMAEMG